MCNLLESSWSLWSNAGGGVPRKVSELVICIVKSGTDNLGSRKAGRGGDHRVSYRATLGLG